LKNFIIFCSLILATNSYAGDSGYHIIKRLKVSGDGSWDYLTIDESARRLYISRSTHVMIIDIDKDKIVGDIPDTPGVHGIAVAPEFNRGFTSNGKADTVTIFNLKTLKVISNVKTGGNPDAILYDPASKTVFTFNGKSKDATVINARSGKVIQTIPLGGKPEYSATDGKGKIYVNIEDTNEVVEIDSVKAVISKRFSLPGCDEPSGMGLNAEKGVVFSGCHNKVMTILHTKTGKVSTVPIGSGVDGNGFDAEVGLAFSSNGDGTLTIVREASSGNYEVVENIATQVRAKTMTVDPKTHNLYIPAAQFEQPKEPAKQGTRQRPAMVKGSFEILVVGK
jgi:YVTN family beta-propeller protein